MKRIGFFAGSFDPFTLGHADIVARALKIFDEVVIGIGTHPTKKPFFTSEQRALQIETVYAQEPRVRVVSYSGMTIEAAKQCGAQDVYKRQTMRTLSRSSSLTLIMMS